LQGEAPPGPRRHGLGEAAENRGEPLGGGGGWGVGHAALLAKMTNIVK
jgi:hypothetical protein